MSNQAFALDLNSFIDLQEISDESATRISEGCKQKQQLFIARVVRVVKES